jgi:hypothetical protein
MQMAIHLNASHNKTFLLVTVNLSGINSCSSRTVEALILSWGLIITDFVYVRSGYNLKYSTMFLNADKFVCMFKI